ncbi:MAG: DUF2971 domain-containing protein [Haliscomenobacter sp.]|nr:DUF2971 domain-containing protein [Haliscomenobacter sp.]
MKKGKIHKVSTDKIFQQKDKPRILFKYQSINDYSLSNLKEGKLWSSYPESFNDPFEYKHKVIGGPGNTEWDELYKSENRLTVVCLTEVPDDLLMWSHYGDSHYGFCMGFEITKLTTKVNYSNDYPTLDFTKNKNQQILSWYSIVHSKSEHWNYEKEHRMIFIGPESLREYPGLFTTIIFGVKTKDSDKQKIREILKDKVNYFQAELDGSFYKINIYESEINLKLAEEDK